jgi:hypothetical protein
MSVVYKAIVENSDFINHLADLLCANPGGLRGPREATGAAGVAGTAEHGHWRADKVGFFFPDLHPSYGTSDIVTMGKTLSIGMLPSSLIIWMTSSSFVDEKPFEATSLLACVELHFNGIPLKYLKRKKPVLGVPLPL